MRVRNWKINFKSLFGLILLALIVLAAIAYFSSSISTSTFGWLALAASVLVLLAAFFDRLALRTSVLFVIITAFLMASVVYANRPVAKANQFQAVFLTNGQVYFGHLMGAGTRNPVLKNVYYLQSNSQNPQTGSQQSQNLSLVKLGNELHGPEDKMVLKSDQILFWENLKDSGKVVQAIKQNP